MGVVVTDGYPPDAEDCTVVQAPSGMLTKVTQQVVRTDVEGMHPHIGKPVPVEVVARQLHQAYSFGRKGPFMVKIPGYGTFRIGSEGWCCDGGD